MSQATDKCDSLLDYMFGELNETDMKQFEAHLLTSRRCSSEFEQLWFVHQRLLTVQPIHSNESTVLRKDLVLQHAYALRPPAEFTGDRSVTNATGLQKPVSHKLSSHKPPKPKQWNKTFWFRASVVMSLLVLLLIGSVFGSHMERFTHHKAVIKGVLTTVDLKASVFYPKSVGEVRITQGQHPSLAVNIYHVPVQPKKACYDVWAFSGNNAVSLGEFLVNQDGSGSMTIDLRPGTEFNRIKITLEPRWGDPSPVGPTVLSGSSRIKSG